MENLLITCAGAADQPRTLIITLLAGLGLVLFGTWYAYHIALRPSVQSQTWVDVVIGVGATCIGIFAIIYIWRRSFWLAGVPMMCFVITGSPMILGQVLKHRFLSSHADQIDHLINGNEEDK